MQKGDPCAGRGHDCDGKKKSREGEEKKRAKRPIKEEREREIAGGRRLRGGRGEVEEVAVAVACHVGRSEPMTWWSMALTVSVRPRSCMPREGHGEGEEEGHRKYFTLLSPIKNQPSDIL